MTTPLLNNNNVLFVARCYAGEKRWPVFPCYSIDDKGDCTCRNPHCASPGKHPVASLVPNGLKNATTNVAVIETWWEKFPTANIAIATGAVSGIVVLDIDPLHGWVSRNELPALRIGKHLRFDRDRVLAHFESQAVNSGYQSWSLKTNRDLADFSKKGIGNGNR